MMAAPAERRFEEANRKILEYQVGTSGARGMGSTAVGALIAAAGGRRCMGGRQPCLSVDGGGLRQLTKDHSLVQRLIEIGQITAEEARHHEHKNVITRSLGARANGPAGAEALSIRLKRGDRADAVQRRTDGACGGPAIGGDSCAAMRSARGGARTGGGGQCGRRN